MRTYGLFGCLADINEAVHFRWLISSCAWPFPVLGVLRDPPHACRRRLRMFSI